MTPDVLSPPDKPTFLKSRPDPPPSFAALRRRVKTAYVRAAERGLFGLVPFRTHVVICGFPRSGTTLLQLMVETSTQGARAFGRERTAIAVAKCTWPFRHPILISKKPDDIFHVGDIREYYRPLRTDVRFIITVRDPRAVLTSIFVSKPGYCVPPEKWRAVYEHIQHARQFRDVQIVEYRDVVEQPEVVQQRLRAFTGCEIATGFDRFHSSVPANFDTRALNGVRPLDRSSFDKWRDPKHRRRIQDLLREMPDLPDRVIEMGYEKDALWIRDYL